MWFVLSEEPEQEEPEQETAHESPHTDPPVNIPSVDHGELLAGTSSNSDYAPSDISDDVFHDTTSGSPAPSSWTRSLDSSLGPAWSTPTKPRRTVLTHDEIRATLAEDEEFTCLQTEGELFTKQIPKNYWAVKGQPIWMTAIAKELQSLTEHGSWKVMPLSDVPEGSQILDTTWVFSLKEDPIVGEFEKARLCVRGKYVRAFYPGP